MSVFDNAVSVAIGGKAVSKLSYGSGVLWELPSSEETYTDLEYIIADGGQYVDTRILASDHPEGIQYTFSGEITGSLSTTVYLFGALANASRSGNMAYRTDTKKFNVALGASSGYTLQSFGTVSIPADAELTLTASSEDLSIYAATLNGTAFVKNSTSTTATMPAANIYLLWINGTSSTTNRYVGTVRGFTMADMNGTLLRDLRPSIRGSDGAVGLRDLVSGEFFPNAGTGSFAAGPALAA